MVRGKDKGKFVMIDGLDGSGKGVIVDSLRNWALSKGMKVFDLREYCKEHLEYPEPDALEGYDVILSAEPTYSHVGRVIRDEIIKNNGREYSALLTAQAFSLDRKILYKKVIIPALEKGIHVFQERGVVTSLVYQPVQAERLVIGDILNLPGNKFALEHAPDLLVISLVQPEVVVERLAKRSKKDDAIFETLAFQTKIKTRYSSDWLYNLFERHGAKVFYLSTDPPTTEDDTRKAAVEMWEKFLRDHM